MLVLHVVIFSRITGLFSDMMAILNYIVAIMGAWREIHTNLPPEHPNWNSRIQNGGHIAKKVHLLVSMEGVITISINSVNLGLWSNIKSIIYICYWQAWGQHGEKLSSKTWKCCPRPQAEGSILMQKVTVFHYDQDQH